MKRCIICGNEGDDNSTMCEVCGNPYVDTTESASGAVVKEEKAEETATEAADQPKKVEGGQQQPSARRTGRRMSSGPQIYGQVDTAAAGQDHGQQGMVRRTVQGRPSNAPQNTAGAVPHGQVEGRMAAQQAHPIGPMQGQRNHPAGSPQHNYPGRPMGQMPGRPMNPVQSMGGRPNMQASSYPSSQVVQTARSMLKSPVFLLIAILYTARLAGSIAAIFMSQMNYSQVVRLIQSANLPAQISGYTNTIVSLLSRLDSGAVVANIMLKIPDLLFCLGLWLIFFMALKAKQNMSGIGFVLVKITVITHMVIAGIAMLACLILCVAIVIASWVSGTISVIIVSALALVLIVTVVMMVIMYYFCYLATLKTCRLNGDEGESYGRVSIYVAVIHIILAFVSIINLLSGIVNSEIANIVAGAASIGWMILFAVWIFMYRAEMDEYEA